VIRQDPSFWSRGEQVGVEELIPETAAERLGKADLPRRTVLDVGRSGGGAVLAPVA